MDTKFKTINQSGSIVIVTLLTLALLSLLGLASSNKSQIDVSISGNSKEAEISLYAAEISLVFAETTFEEMNNYKKLDELNKNSHHCIGDGNIEDYKMIKNKDLNDKDSKFIDNSEISSALRKSIFSMPSYQIKCKEFIPDCDTLGAPCSNTGIDVYKVISTGTGSSNKTHTTLETTFHWRHR
jgi:Tfp pilus assembly protein PilX